ncbi:MAG: NAD(P)/FAD-dependent oxidoreductase, partial [Hyphomicrobiales bacterium]
ADPARLPPSLWAASAEAAVETGPLEGTETCDIAIVGGGFTGLSAALHARLAGASVCLVEAGEPGWGASGRNGGQVIAGLKWSPQEAVAKFGRERGERLVAFSARGPDLVFELIEKYGIECEARRAGWLQAVHSEAAMRPSRALAEQWQSRGEDVEFLGADEARRLLGSEGYIGALHDKRCGSVNPLSYARGLARAAISEGARIFTRSEVVSLERGDGKWSVATAKGKLVADRVILATNAYGGDIYGKLGRSYFPVNSFIVATRPLSQNVLSSILPEGHCMSDTRKFLIYARTDDAGRFVVGGRGSHHDPDGAGDFTHVEQAMHKLYPQVGDVEFDHRWSGRIAITPDMYPHVHEPEPGLTIALGYNGRGVALATALGGAMGRHAVSGDASELPVPVSSIKAIPFHGAQRLYLAAVTMWYRTLDAIS